MSKRKPKFPKQLYNSPFGRTTGVSLSEAFFGSPEKMQERRVERVTFDLRNRIPRNAVELQVDILLDEGVWRQVIRRNI